MSFKIIWIIIFAITVQLLHTVVLTKKRWSPIKSHQLFFQLQHLQKDPQLLKMHVKDISLHVGLRMFPDKSVSSLPAGSSLVSALL